MTGMSVQNNSGWRVVEYNCLVLPKEVEKTTKGGLLLPEQVIEKDEFARMEGILVDASPMAFTFEDWPAGQKGLLPKIGDRVCFSRYAATQITGKDGQTYWLMKDKSIVAVAT